MTVMRSSPRQGVAHLDAASWSKANRALIAKMIGEFAHERLLEPRWQSDGECGGYYRIETDLPPVEYTCMARRMALDHWCIDSDSIRRSGDDGDGRLDALTFLLEVRERLGIDPAMLPEYLEEVTATLYASAYKCSRTAPSARQLIDADFQAVEAAMTEGHPAFVANSGRIGFDAVEYRRYAPETGHAFQLIWLAGHRERLAFAFSQDLDYESLIERELAGEEIARFHELLTARDLNPGDYRLIPVHPWQWYNKLAHVFAPELASGRLVCLGPGADSYQPQQSIRTLFNRTRPQRCYVKTALSVLNMGFMRGLSPDYMSSTPPINDWVHQLIESDPELGEAGFAVLREVAAAGYRHPLYEEAAEKGSPYRKMLAALWRESPMERVTSEQRLMTMAALLHRDADGGTVAGELIHASGLAAEAWLDRYLRAYLRPLLHCFYRHDLVFMPHGENLILVLEDSVPVRCFMKDVGEEVAVMDPDASLPEEVQRIAVHVPEELKILSLFTDIFDYFFRYLAAILVDVGQCTEQAFWDRVAHCVDAYRQDHPELAERFARHDLFAPQFRRSCMNRLQFANNRQLIDLADPTRTLQFAGTLDNPISTREPEARTADCSTVS